MLKIKPTKTNKKSQRNSIPVCQNVRVSAFNTKGYFSSSQPYAQDYLKVKQQVFKKYRNKDQQLVVIDTKITRPSAYIHKGLLLPSNHQPLSQNLAKQKLLNNFIKNYMTRKEKRQQNQSDKFIGINGLGNNQTKRRQSLGVDYTDNHTIATSSRSARPQNKSVYRVSTSKSNFQNKQN